MPANSFTCFKEGRPCYSQKLFCPSILPQHCESLLKQHWLSDRYMGHFFCTRNQLENVVCYQFFLNTSKSTRMGQSVETMIVEICARELNYDLLPFPKSGVLNEPTAPFSYIFLTPNVNRNLNWPTIKLLVVYPASETSRPEPFVVLLYCNDTVIIYLNLKKS